MLHPYASIDHATARQRCRDAGGELWSINSNEEQGLWYAQLSTWMGSLWLGLVAKNNVASVNRGDYVWLTTGQGASWSNWHDGEPNNNAGVEGVCAVVSTHASSKWNDADCNAKNGYGCEWPVCSGLGTYSGGQCSCNAGITGSNCDGALVAPFKLHIYQPLVTACAKCRASVA